MTAAPHSPLFEAVWRSIVQERLFHDRGRFEPMSEERWAAMRDWYLRHKDDPNALSATHSIPAFGFMATQAVLDACHAEEMLEALKAAHAHVQELRDAWERGAISEHDGRGGTRSNRNVDVEVQLRALLAKLDGRA